MKPEPCAHTKCGHDKDSHHEGKWACYVHFCPCVRYATAEELKKAQELEDAFPEEEQSTLPLPPIPWLPQI